MCRILASSKTPRYFAVHSSLWCNEVKNKKSTPASWIKYFQRTFKRGSVEPSYPVLLLYRATADHLLDFLDEQIYHRVSAMVGWLQAPNSSSEPQKCYKLSYLELGSFLEVLLTGHLSFPSCQKMLTAWSQWSIRNTLHKVGSRLALRLLPSTPRLQPQSRVGATEQAQWHGVSCDLILHSSRWRFTCFQRMGEVNT